MQLLHETAQPLYIQLKELLMSEIKAGRYQPHQRLPSERELCVTFQVSRMTVRQALVDLARDGAIYTRVGKGTFVAPLKIDQHLRGVTSFSQEMRSRGDRPSSVVLEARTTPATPEVAAALLLLPGTVVIALARVRLVDGLPLALEQAFLPAAFFPELLRHDFAVESLYEVLERDYQLTLVRAQQTIEAALATTHECSVLQVAAPAAVLKMQRLTHAGNGVPVEYVLSTYRGDRYTLHSTLQPRPEPR